MKTLAKVAAVVLLAVVGWYALGMIVGTLLWLVRTAFIVGLGVGAVWLWRWSQRKEE